MVEVPVQKTCCSAAHSASAHVMTTVEAFGNSPAEGGSRLGACLPTTPYFTTGNGGPCAIPGLKLDSVAACSVTPRRNFGLWPCSIVPPGAPREGFGALISWQVVKDGSPARRSQARARVPAWSGLIALHCVLDRVRLRRDISDKPISRRGSMSLDECDTVSEYSTIKSRRQ